MDPRSSIFAVLSMAAVVSTASGQTLPAFPGAEGFGSIATGGRGGDVYYVTNLNASGAGSFAEGIATAPAGGRTILFKVSGHIRLPSGSGGGLTIGKSKITVAGQTAPGDGICFWNNTMNITGNDLVFRNIRWRYGKQTAGGDAVDINGSERVIFDHCDVMFSTDENMSSFGTAPEHLTFQWSTNAWGLSGHSAGGLWKTRHATVHHTLWANNHTRNPKLIGCDVFDWVNNVTFGWDIGFNMSQEVTGGLGYVYRLNVRGSSFIHGGSTSSAIFGGGTNDDTTNKYRLHMADSALDGSNNGILDVTRVNYAIVASGSTFDTISTAWPQTTDGNPANPVIGVPVTVSPRHTAYKKVLSKTGAVRMEIGARPLRDEITQLCVDRVVALQRGIIADPLELGLSTGTAFASLKSSAAPADGDADGLPDFWEDALGTNPAVANHNTVFTAGELPATFFPSGSPVGYTHLEEYLHFKAVPHAVVGKNTPAAPSSLEIDLRKFTSGFSNNPVFIVSGVTNGTVVPSGPGDAVVTFTPTVGFSGRAGFQFTVTDAAGDTWTQQCCLLVSTQPLPRPVTWVGDGTTNNWDTVTPNFSSLLGPTAFANGDAVTIDDTGSNDVSLKVVGSLAPAALNVANTAENFTIAGSGSLASTGAFSKSGAGALTISNTGPNTFTGSTLEAGTLTLTTANALGTTPITFTGGTLAFSQNMVNPLVIGGNVALNPSGSREMSGTWSGAGEILITNTGSNLFTLGGGMSGFSGMVSLGSSTGSIRLNGNTGSTATHFDLGSSTVTLHTRNGNTTVNLGALTGGSGTRLSGATSVAGTTTYSIGAMDLSTVFGGNITNGSMGNTAVTKTGSGTLTLTGASTYTGATNLNEGEIALSGSLGASPVNVAANALLSGAGSMEGTLTTTAGAIVSPGADNGTASGTLTVGALALTTPTLRFDLSSNPVAGNDRIQATGALGLTGTQNFVFNLTNGFLAPGTYDLITTPGTLTASSVTLTSNLPTGTRQTLALQRGASGSAPGYVRLVVTGSNADLIWTGANGGFWDQQTTVSWSGASPATFFNHDNVLFNDTASTGNVIITSPVAPQSLIVNNTAVRPYTFTGAPITGTTSLVKSGVGTLTLNVPMFTLSTGTTSGGTTATVSSTAGLAVGMNVIGSGIADGTTIAAIPNATTLTLSQPATATSASASLIYRTENTFSGGTFLNGGAVVLTSNAAPTSGTIPAPANPYGLGSGPITFDGGTLTLQGHANPNLDALYGPLPNDLVVPAGQTGTLNNTVRGSNAAAFPTLTGSLTGSGTLNLAVNYFRAAITGDWSPFAGTINVSPAPSGVGNPPRFQLGAPTGLPLATVNLQQVRLDYTATPPAGGIVVEIGSLSGISSSVISGGQVGTGSVTWRVGSLGTSTTFAGSFTPFESRPIGLAKAGSGTWMLTGAGTVSGGITVEEGTLSYGDATGDVLAGTSAIAVEAGATLQLNAGATMIGSSLDLESGATLRGRGTLNVPDTQSGGTVAIVGGTLTLNGNANLSGNLEFSSLADRLVVNGDLSLQGALKLPSSGLSLGRKLLATYTGAFVPGNLVVTNVAAGFLAIPDTGIPGEIAVLLLDQAAWQAWQTEKFSSTTSPESQPDADPDNDGMLNHEEFQAGTNPNDINSFVALVWQGIGVNPWDQAITAAWLENSTPRVFRDKRHVVINDAGSNTPSIDLRDPVQPGSLAIANATKAFTLTGDGSIGGGTGITKSLASTFTIATANTFTGPVAVNEGVLNIRQATALGSVDQGTTVAAIARLELQDNITVTGESLTLSGTGGPGFFNGALNSKSGVNTWAGPIMLAATNTRIGAQSGATLHIAGPIASAPGINGLVVRSADMTATVQLSGANTYAGETNIVGGVLKLGAADTLPVTTKLRFGLSNVSGKLDLNGFGQEVAGFGPVSGTANEILAASGGSLTVNLTADALLPIPINGSAALKKSGPAKLTVSSTHGYTGPTTVAGGTLLLNLAALPSPVNPLNPTSPLVMAGGTLEIQGKSGTASSQTFSSLSLAPDTSSTILLTPNGSTLTTLTLGDAWTVGENATLLIDLSAGNCVVASNPALTGGFLPGVNVKDTSGLTGPATVVAGQIVRYIAPTLTTSSDDVTREFSSLASVYSGGTLDWTNGGLLANRAVYRLILDTTQNGGTIDLGAPGNVLTLASGEIQFLGTNNLLLTGGQLGAADSTVSLTTAGTATLTLASPVSSGTGSLSITGTANVILNSAITFTGGITVDGGTVTQGVSNAFGSINGTLTLNSGALDLNSLPTNLGILTGLGGSITSPTATTLTIGNNNATGGDFSGSITGPIALGKTGSGTQILSGNNPYTGLTTVSAGTLRSGADHAIGNGDLALSGGTLDLQSFSDTVAALTLNSGSITGTTGLLTATSYSLTTGTISASIGGASSTLAKSGSLYNNTATISGANTYGGITTFGTDSGTLVLAHQSALGNTPSVTLSGGGNALRLANGVTISGIPITIRGTGANNANSGNNAGNFSGSLTTSDNATAAWTGTVIIGDATARIGTGNNSTLTVSGPILGSGGNQNLSVSSVGGTVVVATPAGQSTFTGRVNVVRGHLKLGAHQTLPSSAIVDVGSASVADTVSFDLNGYSQDLAGVSRTSTNTSQSSTITNSSPAPATLSLIHSTNFSYSGRITGNLILRKAGAGSFTLPRLDALAASVSLMLDEGTLAVHATATQTVNALRINGVWQPAGTYTSANGGGRIASGTIEVTTDGPGGFTGWITGFPALTGGQLLPDADPDHDGMENLLEYVLGGEPDVSDPGILPAVALNPTHVVFSFDRLEDSITDTTQVFQYGNDLDGWTDVMLTAPIGPEVSLGTLADGLRPITISIPRSPSGNAKLFGRFKVTSQ